MASKIYGAIGLTGGSNGFVDEIKLSVLQDADMCIAIVGGATDTTYIYTFDSGSSAAENSPQVIKPNDAGVSNGRWILTSLASEDLAPLGDLTVTGNITAVDLDLSGDLDITGALTFDGAGPAITEIIDDDTMATATATNLATAESIEARIQTVAGALVTNVDRLAGWMFRTNFIWVDVDTITMESARYHLQSAFGEDIYKWDSQLTFDFESGGSNANSSDFGTDEWHYLYIDDSSITGATLTAANFLNSTTAPTWDASECGWYNGADRCIGAFWVNSSGELEVFYHTQEKIIWGDQYNTGFSWTNAFQDLTMRIPAFAVTQRVPVTIWATAAATYLRYYWRVNGTSDSGHEIGYSFNSGSGDNRRDNSIVHTDVFTDTSGITEFRNDNGNAGTSSFVLQNGYYLPRGM